MFIYLIGVFVATCLISAHFLSQGTEDMTAQMSEATLPVVHINMGDVDTNYMYGYLEPMECAFMRDTLTVIGSDRKVNFTIDTYGTKVREIDFEIRSIDGSRLVESTEVFNYSTIEDSLKGSFVVKDLIEKDKEYMLVMLLDLGENETARYYTRLLWSEDAYAQEKVEFIDDFCRKTFDKEAAQDITKYLETNYLGDNSSYHYADIHSSFNQVTWGNLDIVQLGNPRVDICEITPSTGYFKVNYQVEIAQETGKVVCNVTEYYRIRYTVDRVYLLNWERECDQIFEMSDDTCSLDRIDLGIIGEDVEMVECEGGNVFAFVDEGKLISVNTEENKVALLYSFYSDDIQDLRASNMNYNIHILNVDETGDVDFMVYGYMNRGIHEGHVGISVYEYNRTTNTIEEKGYVDYKRSAGILMKDIAELAYIDRDGNVYFMMERNVYEINMKEEVITLMAAELKDGSYKISDSGRMIVWQNEGDIYSCTRLRLMNLTTGISEDIKSGYGEYIMPLGFMGEDLVYGLARIKDVKPDPSGTMMFPMYKIIIRSDMGELLKEYQVDDIYVMNCTISNGLMNLSRAKSNEKYNLYEEVTSDQIMSTAVASSTCNEIKTIVTEALETTVNISIENKMAEDTIIYQTPREVIYEGNRELLYENKAEADRFYVYGLHGYSDVFLEPGNAVNRAYEISGLVLDGNGEYIWYKTTRVYKNQIMAITEPEKVNPENSLGNCIDVMLRLNGTTTNSQVLLLQGNSAQEILDKNLDDVTVLNLTGCNLDVILYYVNKDIPVLAVLNDSTAMLVTGFNESQVVLYDPSKGELRKESISDVDDMFRTNGYRFLTYN